jgi:hypothetical protein
MSAQHQEWSIAIYIGTSPYEFAPAPQAMNPVLTRSDVSDVSAVFVADPFMLRTEHTWYMFFEVMHGETHKGEIGLATSHNGLEWQYQQIVLRESFHLSYPHVFAWQGAYFMIPESCQAGGVRLYEAVEFPWRWAYRTTLLTAPYIVDASPLHYADRWWLFAETSPTFGHDTLRLYYAEALTGPWYEHPASPLIAGDAHRARPAGRVSIVGRRIVRYTQDCYPVYGTQVRAVDIHTLNIAAYGEQVHTGEPVLRGSGTGWNASGMHHIDPWPLPDGTWLACVDGFCWSTA